MQRVWIGFACPKISFEADVQTRDGIDVLALIGIVERLSEIEVFFD